jgi:hypothetical protein
MLSISRDTATALIANCELNKHAVQKTSMKHACRKIHFDHVAGPFIYKPRVLGATQAKREIYNTRQDPWLNEHRLWKMWPRLCTN